MNKTIAQLSRFAGVLITLLAGLALGQDLIIQGTISGDIAAKQPGMNVTAAPTGTSTSPPPSGGYSNNTPIYSFNSLSLFWCGTVTPSCPGFAFTPKCSTVTDLTVKTTIINFIVKDTTKPTLIIKYPLKGTSYTKDQKDTIKIQTLDNCSKLLSIRYDYSIDTGKTWNAIDSLIGKPPTYIRVAVQNLLQTSAPFTASKVSESFTIRVIATDLYGLSDSQYVTIKVIPSTSVIRHVSQSVVKQKGNAEAFDLAGRKILGNRSMKCYAIRTANITQTKIILK